MSQAPSPPVPQARPGTSTEDRFKKIQLTHIDDIVFEKGMVAIRSGNITIYFSAKRGRRGPLSKLARNSGLKVKQFLRMLSKERKKLIERINKGLKSRPLYVSVTVVNGKNIAYAVGTETFTEIPHRVLFGAVEKHLNARGIVLLEPIKPVKMGKKTIAYYYVYEDPETGIRLGVGVSNANIGYKAIHVFPVAGRSPLGSSRRIMHKGTVDEIVERTLVAVDEILTDLLKGKSSIVKQLRKPIRREEVISTVKRTLLSKKVSHKTVNWILNYLASLLRYDKVSIYDVMQMLSKIAVSVSKKNKKAGELLEDIALSLLKSVEISETGNSHQ